MKEKSTLQQFVDTVSFWDDLMPPMIPSLTIERDLLMAARDEIVRTMDIRSRGGRNSRGKSGRKIVNDTPHKANHRERMRRSRERARRFAEKNKEVES